MLQGVTYKVPGKDCRKIHLHIKFKEKEDVNLSGSITESVPTEHSSRVDHRNLGEMGKWHSCSSVKAGDFLFHLVLGKTRPSGYCVKSNNYCSVSSCCLVTCGCFPTFKFPHWLVLPKLCGSISRKKRKQDRGLGEKKRDCAFSSWFPETRSF